MSEEPSIIRKIEKNIDDAKDFLKRRFGVAALALTVCLLVAAQHFGVLDLVKLFHKNQPIPAVTVQAADVQASAPINSEFSILEPADHGTAPFSSGSEAGGLVQVQGKSTGSNTYLIILLVTVALTPTPTEYPQFETSEIKPDGQGVWNSEIQVGSATFPPLAGQPFRVEAFLMDQQKYYELKKKYEHGTLSWLEEKSTLRFATQASFTLSGQIPIN